MVMPSDPISKVWFELYLTFSYEFNSQIPFHDLFELNGVSFSVQTLEVSEMFFVKISSNYLIQRVVCHTQGLDCFLK